MGLVADVDIRETITSLFQPDGLLPAQYFERNKKKTYAMPERRLLLAVLEDAVCCFQKYFLAPDKRGKILFKEAESWIFDDDDSGVFSYGNVCDILEIDADYLSRGLLRWREKQSASRSRARIYYKNKTKHSIRGARL
ncbi:MAG: hypothetical protein ACREQA_09720 [Candidatus Binatia bacterium]